MGSFFVRYIGSLLVLMVTLFLSACTTTIYGVPEDQWNIMTDNQRQAAIEGYNERERLREIKRQKEAEREAHEAEIRALEARRQEQLIKERIDAIYFGKAGQYGDLIRITLRGGKMNIGGKHSNYQPVSFKIANGEVKKINIIDRDKNYYGRHEEMQVVYRDGTLIFDHNSYRSRSFRIIYDQRWKGGKTYSSVNTDSKMEFRDVQIFIEIIPHLRKIRY